MFRPNEFILCFLFFAACTVAKPPPADSPWMKYASKPVYARSLGPPMMSGIDTISVPYMPKSPLFPKFVDPKTMISKKTEILANLFGGLGPAYVPPFKPYSSGAVGGTTLYSACNDDGTLENQLTDATGSDGIYKRGIFSPFGSKFGPMSPMMPLSPKDGSVTPYDETVVPNIIGKEGESRRKRSVDTSLSGPNSILENGIPETKNQGPPPPYPEGLKPIPEEPETEENGLKKANPSVPKEYMPGMFGPVGPGGPFGFEGPIGPGGPYGFGGPFGPAVDPSMFIAKKSAFLDTLFKNLATTTPTTTTTEEPVPKSTIVPPSFWLPSSVIPSPTEYNEKVSDFLDKLFDSLKLNKTGLSSDESSDVKSAAYRSTDSDAEGTQGRITRSIQDISSINAAKDTIVDTILSELGDLKGDMIKTLNDLITYEKSVAGPSSTSKKTSKPFAGMWSKPTVDATLPFQQRMTVLSQVFDMLSDLQRNITTAMGEAIKVGAISTEDTEIPKAFNYPPIFSSENYPAGYGMPVYNETLLDAIRKRLESLNYPVLSKTPASFASKTARALPKTASSFWVAYPENTDTKRQVASDDEENLLDDQSASDQQDRRQHTRAVQMQMHQGYQSLPAGAIESVQAGGGSVPGHQGGGIKLLDTNSYSDYDKWANWMQYVNSENQQHRQHHNH